ncbi:kinase-like protein [Acephala macrosclerotiorum]|nr:kinase-like protein [Acephala macrosclerotiorum]
MLGAFTTSFHQDLLKDQTLENQTRNRWTLSKGAAIAFSRGVFRFEKLEGTEYDIRYNNIGGKAPAIYTPHRRFDWKCNLADHSNSGIESPDPELLDIHSRFSRARMWTDIATKINSHSSLRRSQNTDSSPFTQTITTAFLAIWSKFPGFIRFQTYRILRTAGSYLYGSPNTGIQRLPFGMYLKHGPEFHAERHVGEFNALKLVRSQTCIPVPHPIDLLLSRTESFLVTSRIEGELAGLAVDECSDEEMHQMAQDLRSWIAELHAIKMDRNSKYAITNATGGPCLDYRIGGDPVGPFPSEKEFSESLRLGILPDLMHRTDHKIVFTHADLNMRNILVKDGRISGIVDWENAGFFPEYWEYTKCHFGVRLSKRWLKMIEAVFENKYKVELGIERQYWEYHSAW